MSKLTETEAIFLDIGDYVSANDYALAAIDAEAAGEIDKAELRAILNKLEGWLIRGKVA